VKPRTTLRKALADPRLLGGALAGPSWQAWRVLLIAAMGEKLDDDERVLFRELTGREREPLQRVHQFAAIAGRRGGKTRAMATIACYVAGLCDHSDALAPGERGILLCVALDQRVAKIILDYAQALFERSLILAQLVVGRTSDAIELSNGISIEVRPASFRKLRGPTYIGVCVDECAYFYVDTAYANPDIEILNAVEPGLATTGGPLLLASSPHARRGVLWNVYKHHYGADGDPLTLVAHGASRTFNPTLPQHVVDRALEKDEPRALAEFCAQFRFDVETYSSLEAIEACVASGMRERLPASGTSYRAFCDPSGGAADSFALAIGHRDKDGMALVDCLREARPPFSPAAVIDEFAATLKSFLVTRVEGDRYAGEFPRELFRKRGIDYQLAERNKSDLFREFLPLLNSRKVELPDHPRLIAQLAGLERRTTRGSGKDSIDHGPHGHDDLAVCAAGLCVSLAGRASYDTSGAWITGGPDLTLEQQKEAYRRQLLWANIMSSGRPHWG
jgi:hypothetical protein